MRKSVCIISFSPICHDARVLRQIEYLSPYYDLTVIGYGSPPRWEGDQAVRWLSIARQPQTPIKRIIDGGLLSVGRLLPKAYDYWYWRRAHRRTAYALAAASESDSYLANEWEALPVAVEAAKASKARVVFDEHEYSPLHWENIPLWKILNSPAIIYTLGKYASYVDSSTTVVQAIADRYRHEFGFDPMVVLNAPRAGGLPPRETDPDNIRLIHHGGASRYRRLEAMIETIALCNARYSLHLMLMDGQSVYVRQLKSLAARIAAGRVTFHETVAPLEIVSRISQFDIGFSLIAPSTYNYSISLPNKFFDFVAAGLAVIAGPSPSMATLVHQHGLGWVAPSFDAPDLSEILNGLSLEAIQAARRNASEASKYLNADIEMAKLLDIFDRLMQTNARSKSSRG